MSDCGHPILDTIGNMAVEMMRQERELAAARAENQALRELLRESSPLLEKAHLWFDLEQVNDLLQRIDAALKEGE